MHQSCHLSSTSHCYVSQREASLYWGDPVVCIVFTNDVGLQGDRERQAGLPVSPLMDRTLQGGMTRSQVCLNAPTTVVHCSCSLLRIAPLPCCALFLFPVVHCSSSLLRTQGQNNQACIHIIHCRTSVLSCSKCKPKQTRWYALCILPANLLTLLTSNLSNFIKLCQLLSNFIKLQLPASSYHVTFPTEYMLLCLAACLCSSLCVVTRLSTTVNVQCHALCQFGRLDNGWLPLLGTHCFLT